MSHPDQQDTQFDARSLTIRLSVAICGVPMVFTCKCQHCHSKVLCPYAISLLYPRLIRGSIVIYPIRSPIPQVTGPYRLWTSTSHLLAGRLPLSSMAVLSPSHDTMPPFATIASDFARTATASSSNTNTTSQCGLVISRYANTIRQGKNVTGVACVKLLRFRPMHTRPTRM